MDTRSTKYSTLVQLLSSKKMKNKITLFLLFVIAVGLWSCDDDFLDTPSTDLTDQDVWSDPQLAELYLLNLYTSVRLHQREPSKNDGSMGLTRGHFWAMFSSVSDETVYSNDDDTYVIQQGAMSAGNFGFMSTAWSRNYVGIRDCNDALAKIPDLNINDEKMSQLIAEVRFIRAVRYFELLRSFGGAVLIGDRVTTLDDEFLGLYDRSTVNETVDYIVSELRAAAPKLPNRLNQGQSYLGRATAEAALGFISRTLLYAASPLYTQTGDPANDGLNGGSTTTWAEAAQAADTIMTLGFSLVDDLDADSVENFRLLFVSDPDIREDIFFRDYNGISTTFGGLEIMNSLKSQGGWAGNGPMQNFVDDFEMASTGLPISDGASGYDEQDPYTDRDPRFYATVYYHGSIHRGDTVDINLDAGPEQNQSRTGYWIRKFIDESFPLEERQSRGRQSPWRYMRYAEILLNYAEAQNEAAGPGVALSSGLTPVDAVNLVRQRVKMPLLPASISQDDLRSRIQNERRVELALEEHRYYDVRRWMIAMDVENRPARRVDLTDGTYVFTNQAYAVGTKSFSVQHYWMPIPQQEIQISNGALQQNYMY